MARFQILSLIGGGIRGAFITSFLQTLEERLGRRISDSFDLIAGTSTGGIVAAGLAAGRTAAELNGFYERYGAKIFSPRSPYRARGMFGLVFPLISKILRHRMGFELSDFFRSRY